MSKNKEAASKPGFFGRLRQRLNKGDSWLTRDITELMPAGRIDEELLEELETRLLVADAGVEATNRIIGSLNRKVARKELQDADALFKALHASIVEILKPCESPLRIPETDGTFVILMVGVNGAGKTTTIGKLAKRFRDQGLSVMLAAGDTFRAAAVEQLQAWGVRNDVPVVAQQTGADPAAVIFDAMHSASARNVDVLLADTAGRLHTQDNLMEELKKIRRVIAKADEGAPHETMLVLDAGIGQNALAQATQFNDAIGLTGLVVTKLDGTAKGGILLAIASKLGIPIRYVGVGESADDLGEFEAAAYASALLGEQPVVTDA
ncbi:MAG: signal recognition particle-docking protein FtsY [Gammaproteobacteria bacterium]|nr:signal recognition particle-docking protein FtsY [Gammaproteobacteria bacterium]